MAWPRLCTRSRGVVLLSGKHQDKTLAKFLASTVHRDRGPAPWKRLRPNLPNTSLRRKVCVSVPTLADARAERAAIAAAPCRVSPMLLGRQMPRGLRPEPRRTTPSFGDATSPQTPAKTCLQRNRMPCASQVSAFCVPRHASALCNGAALTPPGNLGLAPLLG